MITGKLFILICQIPKINIMATSIYDEKLIKPTDEMLAYNLGMTKNYLNIISEFIANKYGSFKTEWKFYNKKSGWILKLFNKKRNVLFVVPCDKYFRAAFTFGDKASDLVYNSELAEDIKQKLSEAKKYAEGKTIQIDVKNEMDCENILNLIEIKLSS